MRLELLMNGAVMHGCDRDEIRGELSIGRSSACTWSVPKDQVKVSSRHAVVTREGSSIVFRDLDSTNGSFLRGERVARHTLRPGDEIQFGDCLLRLAEGPAGGAKPRHPRLRIRSGPLSGQTYLLTKSDAVIGSDPSAEVSIRDPMLSKRHALLTLGPDGWTVKDLGSTNGTFVDGQRLEEGAVRPLGRKGQFHLAHHGFTVEAPGAERRRLLLGILTIAGAVALTTTAVLMIPPSAPEPADGGPNPVAPAEPTAPAGSAAGHWTAGLDPSTGDTEAFLAAARAHGSAEERKAADNLRDALTRWARAESLLAGEDHAGFSKAATEISLASPVASLKPWLDGLEARRAGLTELSGLMRDLPARLLALGPPLWETPAIVQRIREADALAVKPATGAPVPEGGEYGKWLGAQTTFRTLFEASGKISLTPLSSSPGTPRADEWRAWLDAAGRAVKLAARHPPAAGALRGRIELLRATLGGRDAFARAQLGEAAATPGRSGLLAAVLAVRLADAQDLPRVDGRPVQDWINRRFSEILDATESLQNEIDAAPDAEKPALLARLLREGLPGDEMVNQAWLGTATP